MPTDNRMKLIKASTVPGSLNTFCRGQLNELSVNQGYDVVALSSPGEQLDEISAREKIRTIAVSMERHISLWKDLKSLIALISTFRKEKPDIIHSMTPKAGLLCMLAAWLCRVPIRIHTFTGLVFPTATGIKQKILITTDRMTCACATDIIPEGEGVKRDLQNFRITKKSLKVLGYGNVRGIDLNHYSITDEVVAKASKIKKEGFFTFVYIGRIVRDKGINELVEAFTKLNSDYPATHLILVGRYEENLDPIKRETKTAIDSNNAIEAVGQQSDVRQWLAASDALVFPSYREGFPNVVIEAGAMGLPSIVTDINGCNEIIQEGENGTIIPPRNADALYEAMKRFVTDRDATSKMAANARKMVADRYEQQFVWNALFEEYKRLINESSKLKKQTNV